MVVVVVAVLDPLKVSTECTVPVMDCEPDCDVVVASVVMVPAVGHRVALPAFGTVTLAVNDFWSVTA